MKKITLFVLTSIISVLGFTQSIETEKVKFSSQQLPLEPIPNLEGYHFTVETPYATDNDALIQQAQQKYEEDKANYPNELAEAELQYQRDLAQYDEDVLIARENYKLKADEYDKLSALEKIALKADAPVLRLPSKPYYRKPAEPVYREPNTAHIITFDPKELAGSYLKLGGYDKATDGNILKGTVILNDFQAEQPIRRFTEKMVYNSQTKQRTPVRTYYYMTYYTRPTYVKLQVGNEILFEGIIESSLIADSTKTTNSPNMQSVERQSVRESLRKANTFINSKYGYSQIEREYDVEFVKNKKGEFDDLESAKDLALASYKNFEGGENSESLLEAVEIWKKAYAESDLEDRKARINKKVTISVLLNLINAALVTEQPAEAATYFTALKNIKVPYRVEITLDAIDAEIRDLQMRVNAKI